MLPPGVVRLEAGTDFPDPSRASPDGLVAIDGDLSIERLEQAYRRGIFPWTNRPLTWWSPDPRAIFELDRFHVPRRLARVLRHHPFRVTRDRAFRRVMEGCAAPVPGRRSTWIAPAFLEAYTRWHEQGGAHSVECWRGDELVGGLYGVAIGGFFSGESMFHRAPEASKIALCHLVDHLRARGFVLFDIQMATPATRLFHPTLLPRREFLLRLRAALAHPGRF